MTRGQTVPKQWLILNASPDAALWRALARLPRCSGVLLLQPLSAADRRRLRQLRSRRQLAIVEERPRSAARVHDAGELTRALLGRPRLLLISPIFATASHPDWKPLPRMRAASLARLAKRNAIALGGMNKRRYARIARLGFSGWAGISAFRT